jgi:hypothetical protein
VLRNEPFGDHEGLPLDELALALLDEVGVPELLDKLVPLGTLDAPEVGPDTTSCTRKAPAVTGVWRSDIVTVAVFVAVQPLK